MGDEENSHHLRSGASKQEFVELTDKDVEKKAATYANQIQQVKIDAPDGKEHIPATQQQQMETMMMLQQLLIKQDRMLEDNIQLKQEMVTQQQTINHLHQAITILQRNGIEQQTGSTSNDPTTTNQIGGNGYGRKEQTTKQLQSQRIKQLLESKPFSGLTSQEVSDWIEDFEDKCDDLHLDDDQRLSIAVGLLADNAKLWHDTQKDTIKDWETFKTKLSTYFKLITGTDQFELEQKLHNRRRRHDEPAIDYCHQTLKLCSKVDKDMDEFTRIKHLSKGLDTETRLHMDLKNPGTIEEFLQALIKYEKWQAERQQQQRSTAGNRRKSFFNTTTEQSAIARQQEGRGFQDQTLQQQQQQPQQATPQNNQTPYQRTDWNKTQYNGKTYAGCWSCGDMGHYKYECPKNY